MENKKLGLVGKNISYSFSKFFFEDKFKKLDVDFSYDLFDISNIEEVETIFKIENLLGFNVTQPYKVSIIPYLDNLSEEAEKIGAVNTVLIKDGKKTGYNTDVFGFEKTLFKMKKESHRKALILGNGGAAKAVQYVLIKHHIPFIMVYRNGEINFNNLDKTLIEKNQIIINCTPVGTFPNVKNHLPFPFEMLTEKHLIIDLIYNPEITAFLKKSAHFGAQIINGKYMLEQQAEKAWQIWNT